MSHALRRDAGGRDRSLDHQRLGGCLLAHHALKRLHHTKVMEPRTGRGNPVRGALPVDPACPFAVFASVI